MRRESSIDACCFASLVVTSMVDGSHHDGVEMSLSGLVFRSGICADFWKLMVV